MPDLPEALGSENTEASENTSLSIVLLGESTVAGVGVKSHEEGFAGFFAQRIQQYLNIPVKWKVVARSGFTARKVNQWLVPRMNVKQPDLIVIGLGGNDTFELNRLWKWSNDLKKLINSIRVDHPNTPIVFTNMPPVKLFPAFTPLMQLIFGQLVEMLGDQLSITVSEIPNVYAYTDKVTIEKWKARYNIENSIDDFFSDEVHPSGLTYKLLAWDLAHFVEHQKIIDHHKRFRSKSHRT